MLSMISTTWGLLALATILVEVVLIGVAIAFVARVRTRATSPLGERIGITKVVLDKVRKREPMAADELALAREIIADRTSPLMFALPAAIFALGCFYVFGSLEQLHGATPSERTFLGVIPMITSTSLTLRLLKGMRFKRLLAQRHPVAPELWTERDHPSLLAGSPSSQSTMRSGRA